MSYKHLKILIPPHRSYDASKIHKYFSKLTLIHHEKVLIFDKLKDNKI